MAHFNGNEYDYFQFNPNSLGADWKSGNQPPYRMRRFGTRVAKFNVDYFGPRLSQDYTRTTLGFASKGDFENPPFQDHEKHQGGEYMMVGRGSQNDSQGRFVYNPFQWGKTAAHLRMLDDSMFVMGMYHGGRNLPDYGDTGADMVYPRRDVMDEKMTKASGMEQYKNYPKEGWASFGRKYDKQRPFAGNTWINGMV